MRAVTPASPWNLCQTEPTDMRPRSAINWSRIDRTRASSRKAAFSQPVASMSHSVPTIIGETYCTADDVGHHTCERSACALYCKKVTMPKKTITKFYVVVISFAALAAFFSGCSDITSKERSAPEGSQY